MFVCPKPSDVTSRSFCFRIVAVAKREFNPCRADVESYVKYQVAFEPPILTHANSEPSRRYSDRHTA